MIPRLSDRQHAKDMQNDITPEGPDLFQNTILSHYRTYKRYTSDKMAKEDLTSKANADKCISKEEYDTSDQRKIKYTLKEPLPFRSMPFSIAAPKWPADYDQKNIQTYPDFVPDSMPDDNAPEDASTRYRSRPQSAISKAEPEEVFNYTSTIDPESRSDYTSKDATLVFACNFESGNLKQAFKIGPFSYELRVRDDTNTAGHTQWFFFSVKNMVAEIEYDFTISNLTKSKSLFECGQRPLMYSEHLARICHAGWKRVGENINYIETNTKEEKSRKPLHHLKFSLKFPQTRDTVYLAFCIPYTYTQLQREIFEWKSNSKFTDFLRHKVIGKSALGNNIDMLTISSKVYSPEDLKDRKAIVVMARVHPGESNSSYFVKGFLNFLLGGSPEAISLRETFIIKIIPMLNPDGVILGNHRCNYNGYDLNRVWTADIDDNDAAVNFPEIISAKRLISKTASSREIAFFIDIHGHSRKFDSFLYGCHNKQSQLHLSERIFPLLLHKQNRDLFSFEKCNFAIQVKKLGTARVVLRREFNVLNSFTLEISFAGRQLETIDSVAHYNAFSLAEMGKRFAFSLHNLFQADITPLKDELAELCNDADEKLDDQPDPYDDSSSDDEELRKEFIRKKKLYKTKQPRVPTRFFSKRTPFDRTSSSAKATSRSQSQTTLSNWSSSSSLEVSLPVVSSRLSTPIPPRPVSASKRGPVPKSSHSESTIPTPVSTMYRRRLQDEAHKLLSNTIDLKPSLKIHNLQANLIHLRPRPLSASFSSRLKNSTTQPPPSAGSTSRASPTHSSITYAELLGEPIQIPIVTRIDVVSPSGVGF